LFSFIKDDPVYPVPKEILKEALELCFFSILRIQTALIMAAAQILPSRFSVWKVSKQIKLLAGPKLYRINQEVKLARTQSKS